MYPYHFDQSNRDIGTVKFRLTSRTWRANVDVSSLETVRSPAVMRLSEPWVAPLSKDKKVSGTVFGLLKGKGQIKDRQFFVDQRLFWGMIWPVATIDASAVREMNL
jgi:hypothetical protein